MLAATHALDPTELDSERDLAQCVYDSTCVVRPNEITDSARQGLSYAIKTFGPVDEVRFEDPAANTGSQTVEIIAHTTRKRGNLVEHLLFRGKELIKYSISLQHDPPPESRSKFNRPT